MSRVSILLPFYQAAETLEEAIQSILSQTYNHWELLLLDDGSTDGSSHLAQMYAALDSRIKHHYLDHGGIVKTLNTGIQLSNSPLIARMDADDISLPERLDKQVQYLGQHPDIGLASCLVEHLATESTQQGYLEYINWINSLQTPEEILLRRFVESPFAHPSVIFRRELVEKYGDYREGDFPEDYELWLRWQDSGVQIAKVPEILLHWRDLPHRLSRQDPRYRLEAFYRMKFQYLKNILPDRPLWIWGAGKSTRKRASWLEEQGVTIEGYYDVDPRKVGDPQTGLVVKNYQDLPTPGEIFLLNMVSARGVRIQIQKYLHDRGCKEGEDFLLSA